MISSRWWKLLYNTCSNLIMNMYSILKFSDCLSSAVSDARLRQHGRYRSL